MMSNIFVIWEKISTCGEQRIETHVLAIDKNKSTNHSAMHRVKYIKRRQHHSLVITRQDSEHKAFFMEPYLALVSPQIGEQRVQELHLATARDDLLVNSILTKLVQRVVEQVRVVAALAQLHVQVAQRQVDGRGGKPEYQHTRQENSR